MEKKRKPIVFKQDFPIDVSYVPFVKVFDAPMLKQLKCDLKLIYIENDSNM